MLLGLEAVQGGRKDCLWSSLSQVGNPRLQSRHLRGQGYDFGSIILQKKNPTKSSHSLLKPSGYSKMLIRESSSSEISVSRHSHQVLPYEDSERTRTWIVRRKAPLAE